MEKTKGKGWKPRMRDWFPKERIIEPVEPNYDKDLKIRNKLLCEYRKILKGSEHLTDRHCINICIANETDRIRELDDVSKQNSEEKLCPCGHEHKPRSDGRGLRTYCVEGSNCNSDKCKEFVSLGDKE